MNFQFARNEAPKTENWPKSTVFTKVQPLENDFLAFVAQFVTKQILVGNCFDEEFGKDFDEDFEFWWGILMRILKIHYKRLGNWTFLIQTNCATKAKKSFFKWLYFGENNAFGSVFSFWGFISSKLKIHYKRFENWTFLIQTNWATKAKKSFFKWLYFGENSVFGSVFRFWGFISSILKIHYKRILKIHFEDIENSFRGYWKFIIDGLVFSFWGFI